MESRSSKTHNHHALNNYRGFTLIEIIIAIAIVGILAAIAIPSYINYRYKAQITVAVSEIKLIEKSIINYVIDGNDLPDSLSDLGKDQIIDPWGNPYQYLRLDGGTAKGINGIRRRDKDANPVNSDYDLYSMGKDGKTAAQFTAKKGRDDVVRANDGKYYGLAEDH